MELKQYARTIWKWLWLILLGAVVAGGATFFVSREMRPVYRASTLLFIRQASNPGGQSWLDVLTSERLAANYAQLLTTRPVLEEVAANLGLPEISSKIIVDPVRETQIIALHVEDTNPEVAAAIANELPKVFIEQNERQQKQRFEESLNAFNQQIQSIQEDIKQTEEQLATLHQIELNGEELTLEQQADRSRLETSLAQYRASLADTLKKRDEIMQQVALAGDTIQVVEPAKVPTDPVRPRVLLNTLIALGLGLLLMTAVVFLIEYLDDTIKLPEDASRASGLTALGSIIQYRGGEGKRYLITHSNPNSPLTEGYRTLRTNVQYSSLDKPVQTLMVTSASPGEGKSTTVANLAVVMAQAGKRTLVVDTDLRRPVLHKVFGLPNSTGLTTAILELPGNDLAGYIQATDVENLFVITSGPQPPNPSEMLGSNRMAELVDELKQHADILIFDSPPTLAVTDPAVLARLVDGVLLVVESAKTPEAAVRRAAQELAKVGANILGIVVNRLSPRLAGSYYYYYDYYADRDVKEDSDQDGKGKGRKRRGLLRRRRSGKVSQPATASGLMASRITDSQ